MSDDENENMLTLHTGIGEISVGGFSRNTTSKMITTRDHINTTSNRYMMDLPQSNVRSIYRDRAFSPLSLKSDRPPRFHPGQYASSQRSVVDGRSRSPMSFCSVSTTKSVVDITNALKFETFNTHELQMIKEVVCRKLKLKLRKRYEKNRQKTLLRSHRNNFGRHIQCTNNSDRESSESPESSNEFDQPGSLINTSLLRKPHINHKTTKTLAEVVKADSTQTCQEGRTLKDLFSNEYMFPSQRFSNTTEREKSSCDIPKVSVTEASHCSENEEIFSDSENRKRSLDHQCINNAKRIKLASPKSQNEVINSLNDEQNSLQGTFKKPLMPKAKQKSIAVKHTIISQSELSSLPIQNIIEEPKEFQNDESKLTEVSLKSSFSKRKLFTQKNDLFSSKGLSDTAGPSPQTKLDNKERNKARKLVTKQSCLNRTVSDEEDNVLDLIHKIVPAEQINGTACNVSKPNSVPKGTFDSDVSDTFTDETLTGEVFDINPKENNINTGENCEFESSLKQTCNGLSQNCGSKAIFQRSNCIKSFWETDIESEMETENIPIWKIARPTANRDHLKDVTVSILNGRTQVSRNNGKILTVQDLKNKMVNSKKKINTTSKIEESLAPENTIKEIAPRVVTEQKQNENQFEAEKPVKEMKKTTALMTKNKQPTQAKQVSSSKQSKMSKNSNNCSGCEDLTAKGKITKAKGRGKSSKSNSNAAKINSSLDTSDSLNISSRTRSKQRNEGVEASKQNLSQLSDSFSGKSLRPRKAKYKNDTL